ncbi:hypothetical protein PMI08_01968 [Brevibacillus sp. CF112]|uniref:PAS domain-containing protein n=1 Tax=Brevibacillus TaxID=55080 RepID=UPI0002719933|nr:PAS domain-containing protein [Brevibacillus sp. CF112]EJL44662.1 hypothetical protein PMI08_01968 [Brevibacillus sp. CF112]
MLAYIEEMVNHFPFGIIMVNAQSKIEYVNKIGSRYLNKSPQQINHQSIQEILPFSNIVKVIKTGVASMSVSEMENSCKLFLYETPLESDQFVRAGMVLMLKPYQVNRLADHSEEVNDLKQELESIMNLIGELVTITDGTGKILRVNASCEKVMGVKEWEFVGQPASVLEERGVIDCSSTKKVLEQGRPVTVVQTTKSGRRLVVTGSPIYNEELFL